MKLNAERSNFEEVMLAHYEWLNSWGETGDEGRADFSGADLRGAELSNINLYGANLRGANLRAANLYGVCFDKADLTGANLYEANIYRATFRGAINVPYIPMGIPDTGSFIAWKQARLLTAKSHYDDAVIVKLLVPEDADRICLYNGECRASKVKVLEIQTVEGEKLENAVAYSIKDQTTEYIPGQTVGVDNFDFDRSVQHTRGIFFYMERKQAIEYLTLGRDPDGNLLRIDAEACMKYLLEHNRYHE